MIIAIDGTRLEAPRDLQRIVAVAPVGKRVRVRCCATVRSNEVEVEIGRYAARDRK